MFLDPTSLGKMQDEVLLNCRQFLPELILCGTIVLLLVLKLFKGFEHWHLSWEALTLTLVAFGVSVNQWRQPDLEPVSIFGGMLAFDYFTIFLRMFLLGFAALVIWLSMLTGIPDREDSADFYVLLLGATLGMSIMASANHLLMVFIGIEMASLPSYGLAGFLKGRRQSSEAALKYVVYGGGASGVMLYGISLVAGKFGTGYFPDLADKLPGVGADPIVMLGFLFILIGLCFKLAAVPFHFWCPDVFEGAAAEVAGFLSVASKGAALALLARLTLVLVAPAAVSPGNLKAVLIPMLAFLGALTATFGNLAAYSQTNLKRLLAYSTVAHAGYMMMGLATLTVQGAGAVLFYLVAYLFMNLGAFAIVAFLRNQTGSEDLSSYRGMLYRSPVMVVTLAICLLSLLGLPPLAGFAAKFQIFRVLYDAGNTYSAAGSSGIGTIMYSLLFVAGINTVFSLVYYVRVLKVMILERPDGVAEGQEPGPLPVPAAEAIYASLLAVVIFLLGIFFNPLAVASDKGTQGFKPPASQNALNSSREAHP